METSLMHPHLQTASSCRCYTDGSSSLHLRSAPRFVRLLPVNPIHGHGRLQPRQLLTARAAKGRRRYGPGVPQQKGIPTFPKIEDDGNPKFVVFVRDKRVSLRTLSVPFPSRTRYVLAMALTFAPSGLPLSSLRSRFGFL
jgi:hypothetical protein